MIESSYPDKDEVLEVEDVVQQHQEEEDPTHEQEDITPIALTQQLDVEEVEIVITRTLTTTPIPTTIRIIQNPIIDQLTLVACLPNN